MFGDCGTLTIGPAQIPEPGPTSVLLAAVRCIHENVVAGMALKIVGAVAAQDDHQLAMAVGTQAVQRGHGGALGQWRHQDHVRHSRRCRRADRRQAGPGQRSAPDRVVCGDGQPQPEAKEMRGNGVQVQRTMGGVAMQVNGDAGNGDVGQQQGDAQNLPT